MPTTTPEKCRREQARTRAGQRRSLTRAYNMRQRFHLDHPRRLGKGFHLGDKQEGGIRCGARRYLEATPVTGWPPRQGSSATYTERHPRTRTGLGFPSYPPGGHPAREGGHRSSKMVLGHRGAAGNEWPMCARARPQEPLMKAESTGET